MRAILHPPPPLIRPHLPEMPDAITPDAVAMSCQSKAASASVRRQRGLATLAASPLDCAGVQECSYEDKKEGGGPASFPSSCAASMTMGRNPLLKSRVNSTRNELADSQPELCSTSSDFSIRWGSMRPETFEEDRTASPLFRVPSNNPPSSPSPPYACCESAGGRMQAGEPQPDLTKTVSFSPCGTSSRGVTGSPSGQNHLLDSPNSSLKPTYSPVSKKPKGFHQVLQKIRHGAFVDRCASSRRVPHHPPAPPSPHTRHFMQTPLALRTMCAACDTIAAQPCSPPSASASLPADS